MSVNTAISSQIIPDFGKRELQTLYRESSMLLHPTDVRATNLTLRCICDSPNYQIGDQDWDSPHVLTIGNVTDGILDEAGFTYAHGYLGPGGKENMAVMAYKNWKNVIYFMLNLQSHGKGYYSINEYGGKLTSGNVSYRYEMTAAIPAVVRQFVIASCESVQDVPLLLPHDICDDAASASYCRPNTCLHVQTSWASSRQQVRTPQHGLSSSNMTLITSDCDKNAIHQASSSAAPSATASPCGSTSMRRTLAIRWTCRPCLTNRPRFRAVNTPRRRWSSTRTPKAGRTRECR